MVRKICLALLLFSHLTHATELLLNNEATLDQIKRGMQGMPNTRPSTDRSTGLLNRDLNPVPNQSDTTKALNFEILFEFDSATLNDQSIPLLSRIQTALNDPEFVRSSYLIEGHTDAVGLPDYNLALSKRRAETVRDYLVQHGVNANRLTTAGRGSSVLFDSQNPTSGKNRRVRFVFKN